MRAHYSTLGESRLSRGLPADPESYDITAPDANDCPSRDSETDSDDGPQPTYREQYGVDPIPCGEVAATFGRLKATLTPRRACECCGNVPNEAPLQLGSGAYCVKCSAEIVMTYAVIRAAARFVPRRCGAVVIETTGEELAS